MPLRADIEDRINALPAEAHFSGLDRAGMLAEADRIETVVDRIMVEAGFTASERANPRAQLAHFEVTGDPAGRLCVELRKPGLRQCIVLKSLPTDRFNLELDKPRP